MNRVSSIENIASRIENCVKIGKNFAKNQSKTHISKGKNSFYARRRVPTGKRGKEKLVYMHQMVIKVPEGMVADHINHDGMDNRRANLKAATHSQNMYNRKKCSGSTQSKYKGIYRRKKVRKWRASITCNKKRIDLGYYRDEIEPAKAYDRAAIKYHGQFACLNFPD